MRGLQGLVGTARASASRLTRRTSSGFPAKYASPRAGTRTAIRGAFRSDAVRSPALRLLLTAAASFMEARVRGGDWMLRIDDLDAPRVVPGAIDEILRTLETHGLVWDGEIYCQSRAAERHEAAIEALVGQALCFDCTCTRQNLRGRANYPGTCRHRPARTLSNAALRIRVPPTEVGFDDGLAGRFAHRLDEAVGDFILVRRDGIVGYQLAVVVDDAAMGVTDVVRGADLIDNTPRQLFLIERLGLRAPRFVHVPVITERSGAKLSKHTLATAVDNRFAAQNLRMVLDLLGQDPPMLATAHELLEWGAANWRLSAVPSGPNLETWVSI